jgi:hypothetical protein
MSIFGSIMNAIFKAPAKVAEAASAAVGGGSSPAAAPAAAPMSQVDVAAVLTGLAAQNKLKLDSSLAARKELAKELHYTGDTNDSAAMNIWLHKQVMQKLAENGGKVPDDLKN